MLTKTSASLIKGSLKKPFMVQTSFFDWKRNYVISGPWMLRVQNLRQILDLSSTTWRQLPEADERIAKKNFRIAKSWIEKLKRFCGFFFETVSTTRTNFVDSDNFLLVLVPVIGYPEKSSAKVGGRNHFLRSTNSRKNVQEFQLLILVWQQFTSLAHNVMIRLAPDSLLELVKKKLKISRLVGSSK